MLNRLERKLRYFAVHDLTLYLVAGQGLFFVMGLVKPEILDRVVLVPALVINGEVWRLATFVFYPPVSNPLFAVFTLYFFYLMGTALENHWGAFRYNIYLLIAYVATIAAAFLFPAQAATNVYIVGSVFLAFAYLYPEFVIYLFFILPVKIKWIAALTWLFYFINFAFGAWQARAMVVASVANFLLFFGRDIMLQMRYGGRKMHWQARQFAESNKPVHVCAVCGKTDLTHPEMDFRYCGQCRERHGYCEQHIRNHEHKVDTGG
ncbi:MAG TPA: hypothetical protein VGK99_21785 [Acidobacteriota bacterium]|jgi:hypothetical protein